MESNAGQYDEFGHFFEVRLEMFDGPIDLLLHLVKQNELEVEKLALAEVAAQYSACIENASKLDLEIAGEYLVIAATLLSIKSSFLLNQPVEMVEDEEGNLIDPHEELLARLREAQVYRDCAFELGSRDLLNVDVFAPSRRIEHVDDVPVRYADHDPFLLIRAFKKLIDQADGAEACYQIELESVSIVDMMMNALEILDRNEGKVEFTALIPDMTSRGVIIGTFVALLELCKRQAIRVIQDESFNEIMIEACSGDVDRQHVSSEFDGSVIPQDELTSEENTGPSIEAVNN